MWETKTGEAGISDHLAESGGLSSQAGSWIQAVCMQMGQAWAEIAEREGSGEEKMERGLGEHHSPTYPPHTHTHSQIYIQMYMLTHIHTHTHIPHTYHTHIFTYIAHMHTYHKHTHTYIHIHTLITHIHSQIYTPHTRTHICIHHKHTPITRLLRDLSNSAPEFKLACG